VRDEGTARSRIKVDVWADVMCPWCYIGKRRLEEAARAFTSTEGREVDIEFHSFELDPDLVPGRTQTFLDYNVEVKGLARDRATALLAHVTALGRGVGLDIDFDAAKLTSTRLAHQLIHHAKTHGKQPEAEEALFAAYLAQGRNVSDLDELGEIAEEIGLDRAEAIRALESAEHLAGVLDDERTARSFGISSVPFFVIDGRYGMAGAQDSGTIEDALQRAWAERYSTVPG